ncbi:MAG: hypothetical protein D6731_15625 [Planctomycetota bacterium]|nr:MAG: hypothetical protein D6731_15625 [Planctomycetota bacterium]
MIADPAETEREAPVWADRGWYLAVEYGVLARDRFLRRLDALRALGQFKELLEPGGAILYRNLFREDRLKEAWELFTHLRPWQDRLICTLRGERVDAKEAQDVLWCAAFLGAEAPCRGPAGKRTRAVGCEGARVVLSPGDWDLREAERRHALTFAHVDAEGTLCFDRSELASFAARSPRRGRCPRSPARDPAAFAAAFVDAPVRSLEWPLVAEATSALRKALGAKAVEAEHGFVPRDEDMAFGLHDSLELTWERGSIAVRRAGERGSSLAREVRVPRSVERVLRDGHLLRAVRMQEGYARRKGGHYVLEHRFLLSTRLHLLPGDRPARFRGYRLTTYPRATAGYAAWVERVVGGMP